MVLHQLFSLIREMVVKVIGDMSYQNIFSFFQNKFVFNKKYLYDVKIYLHSIKINLYAKRNINII